MQPFSEGDVFDTFRNLIKLIDDEIMSLDNEDVLKASQVELENKYIEKAIIKPLILHSESCYKKDQCPTEIEHFIRGEPQVSKGTKIVVAIPFEGEPKLWRLRASTIKSGYPDIEISNDEILLSIEFLGNSADPNKIKSRIDRDIESLKKGVGYLISDVDNHNSSASNTVKESIQKKRECASSAMKTISDLGIPIKR